MRQLIISAVVVGVFAVGAGRVAADEPFELSAQQLDGVTAGLLLPAIQKVRDASDRLDPLNKTAAETLDDVGGLLVRIDSELPDPPIIKKP